MAYTSILAVHRLDRSVEYVMDKDKTSRTGAGSAASSWEEAVDYARDREKTECGVFESAIGCTLDTAYRDMRANKERWGQMDGVQGYHLVQSFAEGELTPELAHRIGLELAERLLHGQYPAVVATHLNTHCLHNHIVWDSVAMDTGRKYRSSARTYYTGVRAESDRLCRQYGLSVIEQPQQGRGKQYGEWRAEQEQRPTWRGLIRADIDEAIRQAMTERQFFDALRKKGYAMKVGKDISVRPPGKERFVRLMRNFGEDYSLDNIRRRIISQSRPERKNPEQKPEILRARLIGSLKTARKLTGFRALYVHYCYLLGIFPKSRPQQSRKRLHFLLREDLLKLDAITAETRLLIGHRIDTAEQLFSYRDEVNGKISALTEKRKQLYKLQRTAAVKSDPEKAAEVKAQIAALSKELAALRKEVVLCNNIAERSGVIQEKIKAVREDEQIKGKEKCDRTEQQKTVR